MGLSLVTRVTIVEVLIVNPETGCDVTPLPSFVIKPVLSAQRPRQEHMPVLTGRGPDLGSVVVFASQPLETATVHAHVF